MEVKTAVAVESGSMTPQRSRPTCIVTGGSGFIGKRLVRRLAADGNFVIVLDKIVDGVGYNVDVAYRKCNILDVSVWRHLENALVTPDVIFHLAGVTRTPLAVQHPTQCMETNVMGTARVLEFARAIGVPRVVVASSNVVYAFDTAYKASKIAAEELCHVYNNLFHQSVIALRLSNVYGPGLKRGDTAVFASLRDSAVVNRYIEITGDGEQSRDFTHVDDIVEGFIKAWKNPYKGVIDLCTGSNTTLNEIAKYFQCVDEKIEVRYIAERPGDVKHIVQDPKPAKEILDWEAKIKLQDGLSSIWKVV